MKKIAAGLVMSALLPSLAWAQPPAGPLGIGLGGGLGVSGLSAKYHTGGSAFQAMLGAQGLGSDGGGGLAVGLDYLLEQPDLAAGSVLNVGWNYGLGGTVGIGDSIGVGASGVVGLELNFQPVPIDLVIEYRPGVVVVPDFGLNLINFSSHIRFYF